MSEGRIADNALLEQRDDSRNCCYHRIADGEPDKRPTVANSGIASLPRSKMAPDWG
jgi:hypothetical protein